MDSNLISAAIVAIAMGFIIGFVIAWFAGRNRVSKDAYEARLLLEGENAKLSAELGGATSTIEEQKQILGYKEQELVSTRDELANARESIRGLEVQMQEERKATSEKLELLERATTTLKDTFTALSKQALDQNNQAFITNAEQVLRRFQENAQSDLLARQSKISDMISPVEKALVGVDKQIKEIEQGRVAAFSALGEQLNQMLLSQLELRGTTSNLVRVLQNSKTRGRWGEMQLRKIVEISGMTQHCDFREQFNVTTEDGRLIPDMVVSLPAKRIIVIDAKVPMDSYYAAHEATDDGARQHHFSQHAKSIRRHVGQLSQKSYSESFEQSPEFVLLFLPNEAVFSSALEHDPGLIEFGAEKNVIIATPTTLIALLKAAAFGWRQESIAQEAQTLGFLGKELYKRLTTMAEHIEKVGKSLDKTVKNFNSMVGSIEGSVLPSARRFRDLNVIAAEKSEIAFLEPVETNSRELQAADFVDGVSESANANLLPESEAGEEINGE